MKLVSTIGWLFFLWFQWEWMLLSCNFLWRTNLDKTGQLLWVNSSAFWMPSRNMINKVSLHQWISTTTTIRLDRHCNVLTFWGQPLPKLEHLDSRNRVWLIADRVRALACEFPTVISQWMMEPTWSLMSKSFGSTTGAWRDWRQPSVGVDWSTSWAIWMTLWFVMEGWRSWQCLSFRFQPTTGGPAKTQLMRWLVASSVRTSRPRRWP